MSASKLTIVCPCCEARLVVDGDTGAVLSHQTPNRGPAKSFEEAVSDDQRRRREAEDRFTQAFREHEHRDRILDKKFKEALDRAEKDDSAPPPRPFEFD